MLKDARIHFGDIMNTALTYMTNSWKDLLNYRHDGSYDIDNTEAECKIRSLTIDVRIRYSSVAKRVWKSIRPSKFLSSMAWLRWTIRRMFSANL